MISIIRKSLREKSGNNMRELLSAPFIDPQVNIGKNLFGPNSDINVFISQMDRLNITHAIVIPESTYELHLRNGYIERSCIWNVNEDGTISYKRILKKGNKETVELNPKNPLLNGNKYFLNVIKTKNKKLKKRKLHYAPVLHAKLDSPAYIEELLNDDLTVAIKIHGLSSHCTPADMPDWVVQMAKKYDLPFIIHTDYLTDPLQVSSPEMAKLMNKNKPIAWAKWVINHSVTAYLAHGIRLDPETAKLVNHENSLVVGTGPDYVLNLEKYRLFVTDKDYLETLLEILDPSKILLSSDFAWNWFSSVTDKNTPSELDWGSKGRVIETGLKIGLGIKEIKGILSENAAKFFALK